MKFSFDWDPKKASANREKHKVSFDEAASVFRNPFALTSYDENHSEREDRHLIIGRSMRDRVLIVSYTIREISLIRIISARLASSTQCLTYEKNEEAAGSD